MRMNTLIRGDVCFQFKYGFYFIYLLFSVLYIGLLFAFPEAWRAKAAIIMIFTDPAAMGLFFMGAIVLFEKSERVLDSIAVSPVEAWEYILSKLISIGIISTAVGLAIGISADIVRKPFLFISGVFLCSCLFSSIGFIVACRISTLNQFMLVTVPAEILIVVPTIFWFFWYKESWLLIHPGICMMVLCMGGGSALSALLFLLLWTALFTVIACGTAHKMLKSLGGVRL